MSKKKSLHATASTRSSASSSLGSSFGLYDYQSDVRPVSEIRSKYKMLYSDFDKYVIRLIDEYNSYRYAEIIKGTWDDNMSRDKAIKKACANLAKITVITKEDCEKIPMVYGGKSKKTRRLR